MMFLFGGIPNIYYERLRELAARRLNGDQFTGLPLYPSVDRTYTISKAYCEELIRTLVVYVEGRPNCLNEGLGVVLLHREWERNLFETDFWPFALCKTVHVTTRISRNGMGSNRVANIYANLAISAAQQLRKPIYALTTEFATRLRRTPLLLPVRHFDSQHLRNLLIETFEVRNAPHPTVAITNACARFVDHHPFNLRGRGGSFESPHGVKFTVPGRQDFHGRRTQIKAIGHNDVCFLNARVRLGGFFADGFHYDCTRGASNYAGLFPNCHNEKAYYTGRPHLNVYPN